MTEESTELLRQYREALSEALADDGGVADAGPVAVLSRLARQARGFDGADAWLESLALVGARLSLESALAEAMERFESTEAFREAIYFARCVGRDAETGLRLRAFRRYAEEAVLSSDLPDLVTDREATLGRTTFETAWRDEAHVPVFLEWLQLWRRDFIFVYFDRHARNESLVRGIAETIEATLPAAEAVARLNGIEALGSPVGVDAIAGVLDMAGVEPCSLDIELLADALETSPRCPRCRFELDEQAPAAQVALLRREIDKALGVQQARLAQAVVSKLLTRPLDGDERVERFIQVVQASDLTGLALVLDDGLVDFLRELLGDGATSADGDGVLQRLAAAYPEVTAGNLDAAVDELRRLLQDGVSAGGVVRLNPP